MRGVPVVPQAVFAQTVLLGQLEQSGSSGRALQRNHYVTDHNSDLFYIFLSSSFFS